MWLCVDADNLQGAVSVNGQGVMAKLLPLSPEKHRLCIAHSQCCLIKNTRLVRISHSLEPVLRTPKCWGNWRDYELSDIDGFSTPRC